MSVYCEEKLLRSGDVDLYRRLRLSTLFGMLQEASIRHTEQLGMGRQKTLDRGLLWVVLMQRAEIARMPEYDERIALKSWPGRTMHLLFPRYYRVESAGGEPLVTASALWALVDAETRKLVFPERYGVSIEGEPDGGIPLPSALARRETVCQQAFTVPYSFVDLNGHMNNARYFDLAEDCTGAAAQGRRLCHVSAEYQNEARLGETLTLGWQEENGTFFLAAEADRPIFRMTLSYAPA